MALLLFYFLTLPGIISCFEVIKMRVKEDEDVILPCSLDSTNIKTQTFNWKKDDQKNVFQYTTGSHNNGRTGQDPQFKGRVFHFEDQLQSGNASIVIRKTKVTDSGRYSCIFPHHQPEIRSIIELLVGSCPKPHVAIVAQTKDWALLESEVQGAFPKPKVQWLDSENKTVPAEEPQETESEAKYNIILKATVTKSDVYRCVSTQEGICHQTESEIFVYLHGDKDPGLFIGLIVAEVVIVLLILVVVGAVLYFKCKSKGEIQAVIATYNAFTRRYKTECITLDKLEEDSDNFETSDQENSEPMLSNSDENKPSETIVLGEYEKARAIDECEDQS